MKFEIKRLAPVSINIDGIDFPAFLPNKALLELEKLCGDSFLSIFNRFAVGDYTISDIINMLFVAFKHGGVEISIEDIREMEFNMTRHKSIMAGIGELMKHTQSVESSIANDGKKKTA